METTQALTAPQTTALAPAVTAEDVEQFILGSSLARSLTQAQRQLCIKTALTFGLNPLKREIHFVAYQGQEPKIVIGYDVYIKRAERTKNLDGWKVEVEGQGSQLKAVITIHRKDWSHPFIHEVYYDEVSQASGVWKKMPRFMLKKVAIGQGFRLCFPEEFGGLPYMAEEVGLDEVVNNGYIEREDGTQTNAATGEIVEKPRQTPARGSSANERPARQAEVVSGDEPVSCDVEGCNNTQTTALAKRCFVKYGEVYCRTHWAAANKGELERHPKETAQSMPIEQEVSEFFPGAKEVDEAEAASLFAQEGQQ